jgi:hypothetical protein
MTLRKRGFNALLAEARKKAELSFGTQRYCQFQVPALHLPPTHASRDPHCHRTNY